MSGYLGSIDEMKSSRLQSSALLLMDFPKIVFISDTLALAKNLSSKVLLKALTARMRMLCSVLKIDHRDVESSIEVQASIYASF